MAQPRIALTGFMRSGKSHWADWLQTRYSLQRASFAAPIKSLYKAVCDVAGWDATEKGQARPYLQALGQAGRDVRPTFWIHSLLLSLDPLAGYVLDDLRFPDEAAHLRAHGFTVVRVTCPEEERYARIRAKDGLLDTAALEDATEVAIESIPFDFVVSGAVADTAETEELLAEIVAGVTLEPEALPTP